MIYSSPLVRCMRTAEIINKAHSLDITQVDDLRERNFGVWENLTHEEIKSKFPDHYEKWVKDWKNFSIEEGESAVRSHERLIKCIDSLIQKHKEGKLLVVTHLGPIKNIITHLLGLEIDAMWRFRIDNCGITRVEINDKGYAYLTMLNG